MRKWNPPSTKQKNKMKNKCGSRCFLGSKKSFPICLKNTCKVAKQGLMAAFKRASQMFSITKKQKYKKIARTAKRKLQYH